jgi:hypothetical protein
MLSLSAGPPSRLIKDEFETRVQVEGNLANQERGPEPQPQPFRNVMPGPSKWEGRYIFDIEI